MLRVFFGEGLRGLGCALAADEIRVDGIPMPPVKGVVQGDKSLHHGAECIGTCIKIGQLLPNFLTELKLRIQFTPAVPQLAAIRHGEALKQFEPVFVTLDMLCRDEMANRRGSVREPSVGPQLLNLHLQEVLTPPFFAVQAYESWSDAQAARSPTPRSAPYQHSAQP